ncbi:ArsR/SmtB family transcription factor [Brachybacterium hainanense]|uniref:ArsR/SmtB family transcription factor n=1 Tax=Brachybacterium hainanense TaxID=1541174 RepID=A0ABV6RFK8_9MICO
MPAEEKPEYATRDMMRAMAHPLRLQILERVGRRGTARAADVAADLGIPANSVSYHLRILARGGVVIEAPEAATDRRDRVWKLSQSSYRGDRRAALANDPEVTEGEYVEASDAMSVAAIDWIRGAWVAEAARRAAAGSTTEPALGSLYATTLHLTQDQARELSSVITEKISEFNRLNRDAEGVDLPGDGEEELADYAVVYALLADPRSRPSS